MNHIVTHYLIIFELMKKNAALRTFFYTLHRYTFICTSRLKSADTNSMYRAWGLIFSTISNQFRRTCRTWNFSFVRRDFRFVLSDFKSKVVTRKRPCVAWSSCSYAFKLNLSFCIQNDPFQMILITDIFPVEPSRNFVVHS